MASWMRVGVARALGLSLLVVVAAGCDDVLFPPHTGSLGTGTGTGGAGGYCGVQAVFTARCISCHSTASHLGNLDLQTDAHAALVDVTSTTWGSVLLVPGDPDGSLLIRKIEGTQSSSEGGVMPPTGSLSAEAIQRIRDWVTEGATTECTGTGTGTLTTGTGLYHPAGWAAPEVHGLVTKLQSSADADCRECHGADLSGGTTGIACVLCHDPGWETDCTYCHGGELDATGGPPRDINGTVDPNAISFRPHFAHGHATWSDEIGCVACHAVERASALEPGHIFDDSTPGQSEVSFTGVSAGGGYNGAGTCTVYCHSNGLAAVGTAFAQGAAMACTSCHAGAGSPDNALEAQSGQHQEHVASQGVGCFECHGSVVDAANAIVAPSLHVDAAVDLELPVTITFNATAGTCLGTCHDSSGEAAIHSVAERRYLWARGADK